MRALELAAAIGGGSLRIVDLTTPLTADTPVIQLPAPFANTPGFRLEEISRFDEAGPDWYWNAIHTGEHVGTHLDAPIHWRTGAGGLDVARIPLEHLFAPVVVIDVSERCDADPDFLLQIEDVRAWQKQHGELPAGSWLLLRTGWETRAGTAQFLNIDEAGSHTPGISSECAGWLAHESLIRGVGVETVGTDAGGASGFDVPMPCHALLLGADKYGLTQLRNLGSLPPTGAVIVIAPLPIVDGSGSPARAFALVDA